MGLINILIADDHAIVREGLKAALEINTDIEVIGEAEDGVAAIEFCEKTLPDIIIMDMNMPRMDGIVATREIKRRFPGVKILLLTMHDNKEYVLDALGAGIDAYLLKMARIGEVHKAINALAEGESYFDKNVTQMMIEMKKQGSLLPPGENETEEQHITAREREIIAFLIDGKTTAVIAETLSISPNTVNNHRANLLKKLGVKNTAEIVRWAVLKGILD